MNPEIVEKILNDEFFYECPNCGELVHLDADILINCRKGIFSINTGQSRQKKWDIFLKNGVINEKGEVLSAFGKRKLTL